MSSRIRHPLKSFVLFVLIAGGGYFAYQNRHKLEMEQEQFLTPEQRMDIRDEVITKFQRNPDFLGFRAISWRPRENRYYIRVQFEDTCENPKALCQEIASFIEEVAEVESTVVGVDATDREIGRCTL